MMKTWALAKFTLKQTIRTKTMIIGASIKDVAQVIEVILAGAHCVAVPFAVFAAMMEHPLTELGYQHFTAELAKVRSRG